MPTFSLRLTNRDFNSESSIEAASLADARAKAFKGALEIGMEEVCSGKPFFGAHLELADEQGEVARYLVAIGATALQ